MPLAPAVPTLLASSYSTCADNERCSRRARSRKRRLRLTDKRTVTADVLTMHHNASKCIKMQRYQGSHVSRARGTGTAKRDLGTKRAKYASSGVPEYWIVDPAARAIEVLCPASSGYERYGLFKHADTLRSPTLPDFELSLSEVFRG